MFDVCDDNMHSLPIRTRPANHQHILSWSRGSTISWQIGNVLTGNHVNLFTHVRIGTAAVSLVNDNDSGGDARVRLAAGICACGYAAAQGPARPRLPGKAWLCMHPVAATEPRLSVKRRGYLVNVRLVRWSVVSYAQQQRMSCSNSDTEDQADKEIFYVISDYKAEEDSQVSGGNGPFFLSGVKNSP